MVLALFGHFPNNLNLSFFDYEHFGKSRTAGSLSSKLFLKVELMAIKQIK
jgi:hypothetical protein